MEDEFIKKLKERYENGEISKEIYEDILKRYLEGVQDEKNEEIRNTKAKEYSRSSYDLEDVDAIIGKSLEEVDKALEHMGSSLKGSFGEEKKKAHKCAGSCVLDGGNYDYISVAGSLTLLGNVVADVVSVAGSLKAEGGIRADTIKVAGSASVRGDIKGDKISIAGSFKGQDIHGERVVIGGKASCMHVRGDRVDIEGAISAELIKADTLKIKLKGKSKVGAIEVDTLKILCRGGFLRRSGGRLMAKRISGSELYLECVEAQEVEGEDVFVGENCNIGVLKAEKYKISKNSKVKKVVRR